MATRINPFCLSSRSPQSSFCDIGHHPPSFHASTRAYIHPSLPLHSTIHLPFSSHFSLILFSPCSSVERAVSVSNGTVSINLTITERWISRDGHIQDGGSQFVLVSRIRVHTWTAHACIYPQGLLWIRECVQRNRPVETGYQGESPLVTVQLDNYKKPLSKRIRTIPLSDL